MCEYEKFTDKFENTQNKILLLNFNLTWFIFDSKYPKNYYIGHKKLLSLCYYVVIYVHVYFRK